MIHVFLVSSKGIPAKYGGYETFIENLTARKQSQNISYHVSCMNNDEKSFEYNGAECFNVRVPLRGALGRMFHVSIVLSQVEQWCKAHPGEKVIVYILGCRIGPLLMPHARRLHHRSVKILCNPDGLEWKRDKWNAVEKLFLRYSESCLVRYSDLVVCDSKGIEQYIHDQYGSKAKSTTFIAYGADLELSKCSDSKLQKWYDQFGLRACNYYLIVGRFVPENNFETMIIEFMRSKVDRDLVIVTNVEKSKFYKQLSARTGFQADKRIKFVGTVYDAELMKKIREQAYGYLHGHEVGGTNPSLLEALASTKLNLLLDVGFNKEVAEDSAHYWRKEAGTLASLIEKVDIMTVNEIDNLNVKARDRINQAYRWEDIVHSYENAFVGQWAEYE